MIWEKKEKRNVMETLIIIQNNTEHFDRIFFPGSQSTEPVLINSAAQSPCELGTIVIPILQKIGIEA